MRLFTLSLTYKGEFRIAQLRYIVQHLTATCCHDCSKWKESPEFGTKDAYEGGQFKLIRSHLKIDLRPISGQIFLFWLVKMQNNVKFCEVYNLSHTIGKSTRKE